VNWRAEGFVPQPQRLFLGGGRGTTAFYRAESVAMIRRLYELQRQGRDANAWLWGRGSIPPTILLTFGRGYCGASIMR